MKTAQEKQTSTRLVFSQKLLKQLAKVLQVYKIFDFFESYFLKIIIAFANFS